MTTAIFSIFSKAPRIHFKNSKQACTSLGLQMERARDCRKLADFPDVYVAFFSSNCTSKIKPMDTGTVAGITQRCKRMQMDYALDNIYTGAKIIYNVEILTAIRWSSKHGMTFLRLYILFPKGSQKLKV